MDFGLLYDSIEAAPDTPMTEESIPKVVEDVRGGLHMAVHREDRQGDHQPEEPGQ
ncbi:hypothetical protein [Bifidobacterium imperatoris]|uniref:hypothetical protein n=1 Tax=Bifidobacterium imperatoris TaxID=2020965 RepID=UPI001F60B445|nr:hypothetical protein [Bifidobacterium imperatoris]